jgi:hypothetical protein
MIERALSDPSQWSLKATQGQAYFSQRLSREQSVRALDAGFSLLARTQPVERSGGVSLVVNTGPVGPRFDVMVRRVSDRTVEIVLLSTVIPREGSAIVVDSAVGDPGPLIELRYRPQWRSAALYVNGLRMRDAYVGHHQFQDPLEGSVVWGVGAVGGDMKTAAAASFQLVWLEVF